MVRWLSKNRCSPIGVDLGGRSIKLLQFDAQYQRVIEAVRWDLSADDGELDDEAWLERTADALCKAQEGRNFRGRDVAVCLSAPDLFVQNIRVPKSEPEDFQRLVLQETAGRLPFAITDAEIRFYEVADVRQGDSVRREVLVFAVHRAVVNGKIEALNRAGLRPAAIDAEPSALLRCYANQNRRDEDRRQRSIYVNVGGCQSSVVIAEGFKALFVKYIEIGGRQMDEAVSQNLGMELPDAAALRRHNGDRRAERQDPEVSRSISESVRPVIDQLANELSMCVRYHSVTFRGKPLSRLVLGGGEATQSLVDAFAGRLGLKCELGAPLRDCQGNLPTGNMGQWDVAAGLTFRSEEITELR